MHVYGYARVSTGGQELDIQFAQLRAAGCTKIFCEKESGTKDDRRQLKRLLRHLKPGDTVIVAALDRFTRGGPFKTLSLLNEITSRGAAYKSLAEPWADTTTEFGEIFAAIIGYIARKTREDASKVAGHVFQAGALSYWFTCQWRGHARALIYIQEALPSTKGRMRPSQ